MTEDIPSMTWILEGAAKRNSVMVARAIVKPEEGKVPIRLLNPRDVPVTVYQGATIATLERVDVSESINAVLESERATPVSAEMVNTLWNLVCESDVPLSNEEKEQLYALLREYSDIFAFDSRDYGGTNKVYHRILTNNAAPIRQAFATSSTSSQEGNPAVAAGYARSGSYSAI